MRMVQHSPSMAEQL